MYCIVQVYRGGAGLPHLAAALNGALPEGGLAAGPAQHQHGRAVQVNIVQCSTVQYSMERTLCFMLAPVQYSNIYNIHIS